MTVIEGVTPELVALRVAREFPDGAYVNLGYGTIPSLVSNLIQEDKEVIFQSENGVLGYGPVGDEGEWDPDLVTATGLPATELPGASYFDSSLSFTMLRGGHVDITVLSAYQVSEKGDLANWALSEKDLRAVGGAMDLVAGVEKVFVAVQHTSPRGAPRIVKECTFPITAKGVVSLIFTDLAVVQVVPEGLILKEIAPGLSMEQVQSVTEPKLIISKDLCDMQF